MQEVKASSHVKWRDHPRGPYIRMRSGRKMFLKDPQPGDWYMPDVAHHLARVNRYTGASELSDAQHMVVAALMAERFYPGEKFLPARMMIHDISEAVYGDVSAPLKSLLPGYKELELAAEHTIEAKMDLMFVGDPLVKEVDDRMWLTERLDVYGHLDPDLYDVSEDYDGPLEPFPIARLEMKKLFKPWGAAEAHLEYAMTFRRLLPWVQW